MDAHPSSQKLPSQPQYPQLAPAATLNPVLLTTAKGKNQKATPAAPTSNSQSQQQQYFTGTQALVEQMTQLRVIEEDEIFNNIRNFPHRNPLIFSKSSASCKQHPMCQPVYMQPVTEHEARLPMPFPLGTAPGTHEFTRHFAVADFETRNLVSRKCKNVKMVMTEEVLDDWEAQTLNIPFERLVRHKKTMKNLENLERQRNQMNRKPVVTLQQPASSSPKQAKKQLSKSASANRTSKPRPGSPNKKPGGKVNTSASIDQTLIQKRQQQQIKNFNMSLLRGTNGNGINIKRSEDLVPKFYWKHTEANPFIFDEDDSVHHFDQEEAVAKAKVEGELKQEESKVSLKKDSSDLRLMGQKTIMETKRKNEEILSRFSSQQKELLRNIGGLPIKVLNEASQTFRLNKANTQGKLNQMIFAREEQVPVPQLKPHHIQGSTSPILRHQSKRRLVSASHNRYAAQKKNKNFMLIQQQQVNQSLHNASTEPTLHLNASMASYKLNASQSKAGTLHGGASISTASRHNFWVTDAHKHQLNQSGSMNDYNPKVSGMTLNEKSFYTTFTRREAPEQSSSYFVQTKRQAIDQFMKLKLNQPHDKSSSSIGRDGIDQQSTQNSQQMGKRDPAKFERRILERIRYEDEFEQERPSFKVKEVDLRKIRLNKVPFEDKPDSKLKNMRLNFDDSDFWYLKGYDHWTRLEIDSAIDSYRQAIRLDQHHYSSMLNLAGCYESQQLFAKAIIWYEFALCVRPEADDAHFGISVCALKSGDPSRALANADIALKLCCAQAGGEALLREEKIHLTYMRAVALKSLRRFKEAQVAYTGMVRSFSRQEGLKIAKYIFGMILMPLETNRKKIMQYVEGFQGILDQFEGPLDRRRLIQYSVENLDERNRYLAYDNKDPKWFDRHKPQVLTTLRQLSFFQRFSLVRQREMMNRMRLKLLPKNSLLFFEPAEVYVVVSGSILLKNHDRNILLPQTAAKFGEGDILNFHQESSEVFRSVETWFLCQVDTEVAIFEASYFEEALWKDLLAQGSKLIEKNVLSCANDMFRRLNDLTMTTMVYELCELRNFPQGSIVQEQMKQAPTNYQYRPFYVMMLSKMALEIKKRKAGGAGGQSTANQSVMEGDAGLHSKKRSIDIQEKIKMADRSENVFSLMEKQKTLKKKRPIITPSEDFGESSQEEEGEATVKNLAGQSPSASPKKVERPATPTALKDYNRQEGLYILESGRCVLRHPHDQFEAKELRRWDFFGECDLLKVIGYTYFGEVEVRSEEGARFLFISNSNFKKIPVYEQYVMKQFCQGRQDIAMLAYVYATRYNIDVAEYSSYY